MGEQMPSVGRVVHVYENGAQEKPLPGFVHTVHSETCINVVYWNSGGTTCFKMSMLRGKENAGEASRWEWPLRV